MSLYDLPKFELPELKAPKFPKVWKSRTFLVSLIILASFILGGIGGTISGSYFYLEIKDYLSKLNIGLPEKIVEKQPIYLPQTSQEEAIIKTVSEASPAVVSIVGTKDIKILEQYWTYPFEDFPFQIPEFRERIEKQEIGGSGFIFSEDGMVLTNKHVVLDEEADYTVLTNDGRKFSAKVLTKDPDQDLAILKIERGETVDDQGEIALESFPTVKFGDSDKLQIGQTVIAIGNVLGEFRNSVSVGVVSGLGRTITASGGGFVETLEDVIQTDAAINKGNSGGPLLNLKGEVIGINTAMVEEAQAIGFAIPINKAKKDIEKVKTFGKIVYPFLGVRYVLLNEEIQKENGLPVGYGAWVIKGEGGEPAVFPGSAAEKAELKENDIILEFNGEKITIENTMAKIIMKYNPGDKVVLKILREGKEQSMEIILGERNE